MRRILDLDILLLVSGIARKHGIVPKPFSGHPQYSPPPQKKIHFLPRTRDFSRKRVCGFSNRQLQENVFNCANLFGGGQSYYFPPFSFSPPNPVSSWRTFFSSCAVVTTTHHLPGLISSILEGKKSSTTKLSTCRKPLNRYQKINSGLPVITCLTIIYIEMERAAMEMFLLLDKYPALCEPKSLGAL
jgi:hypothetical protein